MVFPIVAAAAITAAATLASAYASYKANSENIDAANEANYQNSKETKSQKQKRHLVDDLLRSLKGKGSYSDLYKTDEGAFQKSFVDPAKSRFNNQIAPQIQQNYIANGQQRSTGLDDQLLRAGVDLDSILNQHYMEYYQQGQNRKQNAINSVLGVPSAGNQGGYQAQPSASGALYEGGAAYLSSKEFGNSINGILDEYGKNKTSGYGTDQFEPRKGYEADYSDYTKPTENGMGWA